VYCSHEIGVIRIYCTYGYYVMFKGVVISAYCAITPIHAGFGRSMKVDLVVQRDSLGIPMIFSSSLKGTFKSLVHKVSRGLEKCLGDDVDSARESFVIFTDAFMLAIPTHYEDRLVIYVTCPYLLWRIQKILSLSESSRVKVFYNFIKKLFEESNKLLHEDSKCHAIPLKESSKYLRDLESLFVEDFRIDISKSYIDIDIPSEVVEVVKNMPYPSSEVFERILIVKDDIFRSLVNKILIIQTRVSLEYTTKTAKSGALWREEYVPTGTIFVGAILFKDLSMIAKNDENDCSESSLKRLEDLIRAEPIMAVGGKETVGKGFIKMCIIS